MMTYCKNIILILRDSSDYSTLHVIEWLKYYNTKYFVITNEDNVDLS